jgi:hypothetical protein
VAYKKVAENDPGFTSVQYFEVPVVDQDGHCTTLIMYVVRRPEGEEPPPLSGGGSSPVLCNQAAVLATVDRKGSLGQQDRDIVVEEICSDQIRKTIGIEIRHRYGDGVRSSVEDLLILEYPVPIAK